MRNRARFPSRPSISATRSWQVRVRITAAGLCHRSFHHQRRPAAPMPMVLSHGPPASSMNGPGDRPRPRRRGGPGLRAFLRPLRARCQERGRPALVNQGGGQRGRYAGGWPPRAGAGRPGAQSSVGVSCFAEYAVVNRGSLVKYARTCRPSGGGLRLCGTDGGRCRTQFGAGASWTDGRSGRSRRRRTLGGARRIGGRRTRSGGGRRAEKLELALALGATRAFRADDPDIVAQLRAAIPGGVDVAIEAASAVPALNWPGS